MFRRIGAALVAILMLTSARALAAPVDPPIVGDILDPGGSITVTKTVHTPAIPPDPDIVPVTVTPRAICEPGLSATFNVSSLTVASGTDAVFTETITVAADAQQATTLYCTVYFLLDDIFTPDFRQDINIGVHDIVRPTVTCDAGTNPSGSPLQNGGFYVVGAADNTDGFPAIFISDSASTFVAGPFISGNKIKLVKAPGATPNVRSGTGDVEFKITLNGDAILTAVDGSGNVSATTASCNAPPE